MKTILILFALTTMSVLTHAQGKQFGFVITDHDTLYCQKMNVGQFRIRCTLQSGEKVKIPITEVKMYNDGNRMKEKMPVYLNNKKSEKMALMELIAYKNGIRIYKYEHLNSLDESWELILSYYVKDKFVCMQTNPNIEQVNDFLKSQKQDNELKLFVNELSKK
jgi:hypothetical protein